MDERLLIDRAKRGDNEALASLLEAQYPFLYRYLLKITLNPHLAEDLAQETMVRCIARLGSYKADRSKFSSWLMTIGSRLYIDELRKRRREVPGTPDEQGTRLLAWQAATRGDDWPDVLDALGRLSSEMRTSVVLKHYYGYSQNEIAEMTGVSSGTVKSRIHNGMRLLRKELKDDVRQTRRE